MKKDKMTKGITLISLIVTIILLLILAGVALNIALGDNGIFKKSLITSEKYEIEEVKEKIDMSIAQLEMEKTSKGEPSATLEEILNKLYSDEIIVSDNGINEEKQEVEVITQKGYVIKITKSETGGLKIEEAEEKTFESYENEIDMKISPEKYSKTKKLTVTWPQDLNSVEGIIKKISVDGGKTYKTYTGATSTATITQNGIVYAKVIYGEEEATATLTVTTIDSTSPTIIPTFDTEAMKLTVKVQDTESGLASVKIEKLTSESATGGTVTQAQVGEIYSYNGEISEQTIEVTIRASYKQYLRGYIITVTDKSTNTETYTENGLSILNNKYIITTTQEMQDFASSVNSGTTFEGLTVELGNDIDLSSISNWTPIGINTSKSFKGTFEGNGYTISGLKTTDSTASYVGLFKKIYGSAVIKNFTLANSRIVGNSYVGGIVGR